MCLIKHKNGIPLLLKAILTRTTTVTPLFYSTLGEAALTQRKVSLRGNLTKDDDVSDITLDILRTVLELRPSEQLGQWYIRLLSLLPSFKIIYWAFFPTEPADSLTLCGIDSISFAQIRGSVMNRLSGNPYADSFTVNDLISHVIDKCVS